MSTFAALMMDDTKMDTVDFLPTYDEKGTEPSVLPSKFPNLLVNGSQGIAVGMATSIPPHNLVEICDALISLIDNPDISIDELMEIVPGPDFPTGNIVCGRAGLRRGYHTGRGTITLRAGPASRSTAKAPVPDRTRIVINEVPYQAARDRVEERIAELVNEDRIAGISASRNESDLKEPVRLVLELKKRRRPGGRAGPALPVLASARHVLADLPGPGRRQAAGDGFQGAAGRVHPPPRDRHPPPHAVLAGQGPAAEAHGGGPVAGPGQYRRGDPHHPHLGQPGRGQAAADAHSNARRHASPGPGRRRL